MFIQDYMHNTNYMYTVEPPYNSLCYWGNMISPIDGLVQDCSISIANALEIPQSCTKS